MGGGVARYLLIGALSRFIAVREAPGPVYSLDYEPVRFDDTTTYLL